MTPAQQVAVRRAVTRVLAEAGVSVPLTVTYKLVDVVERISLSCGACAGTGKVPRGRYVKGHGNLHRPCEKCKQEREDEARYDAHSGIGRPS